MFLDWFIILVTMTIQENVVFAKVEIKYYNLLKFYISITFVNEIIQKLLLFASYLKKPYLIDCPIIIELFEMLTLLNASFDEQWHINICYSHVICLADIKKCQARKECIDF